MRILILSQYFWPESFVINDIVRTLDEQGHHVVVATGKPNYPDGKLFEGYRASGTQRERYIDKVDVIRVPLWPRGEGGARNLILNYISFVLSGLFFLPWLLRKREFDAILVFAPSPILQAIPAILLKWLKGAKLALWIQDLWPESLAATGFVKNPYALRAVGWLVRGIYYCCDTLLVQSKAFFEPVSHYADSEKIVYYPNSMDISSLKGEVIPRGLSDFLEKHFCVVFAGNLGTVQALETLLQAAVCLKEDADVRIVMVGSGSRLTWLQEQKELLGLDNLVLAGRYPSEAMPQIFKRSSVLLVSLNAEAIFAQTVPSKVQAYLAAGRPIIASLNGEGARIVKEAGAGVSSPAEQVLPLVAAIRDMRSRSDLDREKMGASGRAYFDRNFEMGAQVRRLVSLLR
jgi:glycosyltransferase involved in cell wall biosynthesis